MSKKKLLGLLTGLLTLGGPLPALAFGEWWSGGFVTPNPLNWTYDSVTMSTNYLNSYVKPAGSQWNGVSSKVQMIFVTSGSYRVKTLLATSPDPSATGLFEPYCAGGSGIVTCINSTWTSGRVYGYENAMAANGYNTTERISNFTHEFGHSLSMAHVTASGVNAVMRQGRQALGTQSYDKANLQGKWGL